MKKEDANNTKIRSLGCEFASMGVFFPDIYRKIQGPLRIGRVVISKIEPHISHAEKSFGTFGSGTKTSSVK
jgi:hypothetical protein